MTNSLRRCRFVWMLASLCASALTTFAAPPPEVLGVGFSNDDTLTWSAASGATAYNVYRGSALQLQSGQPPRCHKFNLATLTAATPALPALGDAFVYVVSGSNVDGESTPGNASSGQPRATLGSCKQVMEHHLLDRITYGWNDYVKQRLALLGTQGFLNEQLNPAAISESDNSAMNTRLSSLTPPENVNELVYRQMTMAVYAQRQLQQVVAEFWNNHFNTDYNQVYETYFAFDTTADTQYREMEHFRYYAFNGTFRDMLEMSALGPAMIPYLDTTENVLGKPNEIFGRELMVMLTLCVDGGYTQNDVREMARVWTGWTVCRKNNSTELTTHQYADPAAGCNVVGGKYTGHFDFTKHDCGAKVLFAGTPQQVNIAATCGGGGQPTAQGINDAYSALDAVADHPSTKSFVSKKLLQKFITETPTPEMIQAVIDRWTATGGNNLEVLKKVLEFTTLMDPDKAGNKIRTPFEQFAATYRVTRADTSINNLGTLYNYLARMQMLPHLKSEPTGYGELARDWINTNDLLERQNFAWDVTTQLGFLEDIIQLLADNGLTAASPPGSIVDFYSNILFGGALTPYERQRAIDFLSSDDNGVPAAVTDDRIRNMVAFMIGFPQYLEQ